MRVWPGELSARIECYRRGHAREKSRSAVLQQQLDVLGEGQAVAHYPTDPGDPCPAVTSSAGDSPLMAKLGSTGFVPLLSQIGQRDAEIARLKALVEAAFRTGYDAGWLGASARVAGLPVVRAPEAWLASDAKKALDTAGATVAE